MFELEVFIPYPSSKIDKLLYLAQILTTVAIEAWFPEVAPIHNIS